jgi:hypothetical protein
MTDHNAVIPSWRKSSASGTGNCVEVAFHGGLILLRDSKERHQITLEFTLPEWEAFLVGARSGEFDLASLEGSPPVS